MKRDPMMYCYMFATKMSVNQTESVMFLIIMFPLTLISDVVVQHLVEYFTYSLASLEGVLNSTKGFPAL